MRGPVAKPPSPPSKKYSSLVEGKYSDTPTLNFLFLGKWVWKETTTSDDEMSNEDIEITGEDNKREVKSIIRENINEIRVVKRKLRSGGRMHVIHISNFLTRLEADALLEQKIKDKEEGRFQRDKHFDIQTERLFHQEGAYAYVYAGNVHLPNRWSSHGTELLGKVAKFLPTANSCTWNYYYPGKIHMGAHSDKEPQIKTEKVGGYEIKRIGTVAVGQEAVFKVMTYLNDDTIDETFYFNMNHGDLLIMTDQTQQGTKHEIAPVLNKKDDKNLPRISATFRTLLPPAPCILQNTLLHCKTRI